MIKLLFVIDSLVCGGAEKSLISLLNSMDFSKYSVDLLLFKRGGEFEYFLPREVSILEMPEYYRYLHGDRVGICYKKKFKYFVYRIKTSINIRLNKFSNKKKHLEQVVYKSVERILDRCDKKYDVAIAYSQGFPTYFVSQKVNAAKKIAWINCNYEKTAYDKEIDSKYYKSMDNIVVVSQNLYNSISKMKYGYKEKLRVIFDIVDPKSIWRMAECEIPKELKVDEFTIVTVGRLATVKGYDLAIEAAYLLKKDGYRFKWYVIGEGPQRNEIEQLIKKIHLEKEFILLGIKSNPYVYMKNCNLYVQTSRKEGFGLSLMEAKILSKPIITTNFDTAYEIIEDKKEGYMVSMSAIEIKSAIKSLIDNDKKRELLSETLRLQDAYTSVSEINKFYNLILENLKSGDER